MEHKLIVGVLFGGRSVEHEISVISAAAVVTALQSGGHSCVLIGIDKAGRWQLLDEVVSPAGSSSRARAVYLCPGGGAGKGLYDISGNEFLPLDVIFPVLHGSQGEDGIIQGALDACAIPYVGGKVAASVLTNDKDITKRLLQQAGIATADYLSFSKSGDLHIDLLSLLSDKDKTQAEYDRVAGKLGLPFWVKPANLGSSLGINQVNDLAEFTYAIEQGFSLDSKIIMEQHIAGRELECSVLQDTSGIRVSLPGEIVLNNHSFYDYDAKYVEQDGAELIIPAEISAELAQRIEELAVKVFRILENRHIMRLDLFLNEQDELLVNEVQTIPGFTSISMYPKLLELAGIGLPELVDRLVVSAVSEAT